MKNQLWRGCLSSPLFIAGCVGHGEVSAQTVESYSADLNQITNVNQLRDVSPTDWAYEALRSLTDRSLRLYRRFSQPNLSWQSALISL